MIYFEDLTENILISEGQLFLGMDYITNTLGLELKMLERIFVKCAMEYSKRRPVQKTEDLVGASVIRMPQNTLAVKAVRYGVLPDFPRFFQESFDQISYEFFPDTKILKIFPPGVIMKVTYLTSLTVTNNIQVTETVNTFNGQEEVDEVLKASYVQGTLSINSISGEMHEISRADVDRTDSDGNVVTDTVASLSGTLGTGTVNLSTREYSLTLLDDSEKILTLTYYPKYKCIVELDDIGDFIFYKLYAYNILKAVVSARAMSTQKSLHNIDLTDDDLPERVRELGIEVRDLLRASISFGAMLDI